MASPLFQLVEVVEEETGEWTRWPTDADEEVRWTADPWTRVATGVWRLGQVPARWRGGWRAFKELGVYHHTYTHTHTQRQPPLFSMARAQRLEKKEDKKKNHIRATHTQTGCVYNSPSVCACVCVSWEKEFFGGWTIRFGCSYPAAKTENLVVGLYIEGAWFTNLPTKLQQTEKQKKIESIPYFLILLPGLLENTHMVHHSLQLRECLWVWGEGGELREKDW